MLTKKLIVPKAVTVHISLVFVLDRVPLGGRLKGASSLYLFFFFSLFLFWVEIFLGSSIEMHFHFPIILRHKLENC